LKNRALRMAEAAKSEPKARLWDGSAEMEARLLQTSNEQYDRLMRRARQRLQSRPIARPTLVN
jgi:hypothetical protein